MEKRTKYEEKVLQKAEKFSKKYINVVIDNLNSDNLKATVKKDSKAKDFMIDIIRNVYFISVLDGVEREDMMLDLVVDMFNGNLTSEDDLMLDVAINSYGDKLPKKSFENFQNNDEAVFLELIGNIVGFKLVSGSTDNLVYEEVEDEQM